MDRSSVSSVLGQVARGEMSVEVALERLRILPFDDLGDMARVDHHRELRSGVPEIVYGESKPANEIEQLLRSLAASGGGALASRVDSVKAETIIESLPQAVYHQRGRIVLIPPTMPRRRGRGPVAVVCAGTSDLPVADEAAITLEFLGHRVVRHNDIGIAGLHRLVAAATELRACEVIVAIAGFEGALPSAISGLVPAAVIAVPTQVGYGVGLGGFAALITMLAGCSPGVSVVNIDNGIGAAICAARINRMPEPSDKEVLP